MTSHHLAPIAEVLMRGGLGSARDPTAMLLGRSETTARLPRQKKLQWICFSMCVILFPCFQCFSLFFCISLNLGACGVLHTLMKLEHFGAKVTKSRLFCRDLQFQPESLRVAHRFSEIVFRNVPPL